MLRTVFNAKWGHVGDAGVWLLFHLVGSLMPVWLGLVILRLLSLPFGFGDFLDKGEFAIYSAAIITPVIHALTWEHKGSEKALYVLVTIICLLVATTIFIVTLFPSGQVFFVIALPTGQIEFVEPDKNYVRIGSVIIFVISMSAAILLKIHDNILLSDSNFEEQRQERQDSLAAEYERELERLKHEQAG